MLFNSSPEKFWNLIAKKYAASPIADREAYEQKIQKIKTYLSPEYSVLDIGCATGTQCGDIATAVRHVTGIDISSKLLAIARQRMTQRKLDNVTFYQTTVFDERFTPGSLDVVMAFHVLHFYEDVTTVFKRIHDLLKPGGLFISETACLGEKGKMIGTVLRAAGKIGFLPLINLLTTIQLEQALAETGFEVIHKHKYSTRADAEFTLVARKL